MSGAVDLRRYVYVVCATCNNYFAEMAAVSISSLRIVSPCAQVSVLTDSQTSAIDTPGMSAIRATANEITTVDCPGDSSFDRSRFLKSNMRRLVGGRFCYLDCDTLLMRSPEAVWDIDCDVAASPDLGSGGKPYLCPDVLTERTAASGGSATARFYLNSGVIYFSDTQSAHAVGEAYRLSWMEHVRVNRNSLDQRAFNRAVNEVGTRLAVLHRCYNAQIAMNTMAVRGAVVMHYYSGDFESRSDTVAHMAAKRLKCDGVLDVALLRSSIASRNPWTKIDCCTKAAATGFFWQAGRLAFDRLVKRSLALAYIESN
jgi:hypothetical protein